MTTAQALQEALNKFGQRNYVHLPLHRTDYLGMMTSEAARLLIDLSNEKMVCGEIEGIKYQVRRTDQMIHIEIWK